jgi:hypothetical protein
MSNVTTSERLWSFTTATGGNIAAAETPVIVRKVVYFPNAIDDDVVIQEYDSAGTARSAIVLRANHAAAEPLSLDFGMNGRRLNGFNLSTIDGGTLYVYLDRD